MPIPDGMGADPIDLSDACPQCGREVTAVVVSRSPRVVAMRSCNRCDQRWWTADGEPVDPVVLFARR